MKNQTALIVLGLAVVGVFVFYSLSTGSKPTTVSASPTTQTEQNHLAAPSLSFSPASLKLAKGDESTISINLDQAQHTAVGVTVSLKYDPAKVSLTQMNDGSLFPTVLSQAKLTSGHAEISVATPPDSKGQTLAGAVLTFQVRGLSSSPSTISFDDGTMVAALDQNGNILKSMGALAIN